ncbi:TIGR02444 family protein [Candidatus Litorirhabdus singularis]|nr:TIGR02444 family protein [Candidatus Litorirhabdus singularis]
MDANLTHMQETNPFWRFSQLAWTVADVASFCLQLQEQHDCDVNMVLWVGWRSAQGVPIDLADLEQLQTLVEPWRQQVILPLRMVRQGLPKEPDQAALRENLLTAELEAERFQQTLIFKASSIGEPVSSQDHSAANARAYCRYAALDSATEQSLWKMLQVLQENIGASLECD